MVGACAACALAVVGMTAYYVKTKREVEKKRAARAAIKDFDPIGNIQEEP